MHKNIIVGMFMCIVPLYSMERRHSKEFSFVFDRTIIKLVKGCIYDADGKVDIIVIGSNQQKLLEPYVKKTNRKDNHLLVVGRIHELSNNIVKVLSKDDDSSSEDDMYRPFYAFQLDERNLRTKAYDKELKSLMVKINEPYIMPSFFAVDSPYYYTMRRANPTVKEKFSIVKFEGNSAIIEAAKDLCLCYNNVLSEGLKKLGDKEKKSIALPILSVSLGFPREEAAAVTVKVVTDFINDHSNAYDRIELFVKKRSEFKLYKELLENCAGEQK